jgi:hypothetical protein
MVCQTTRSDFEADKREIVAQEDSYRQRHHDTKLSLYSGFFAFEGYARGCRATRIPRRHPRSGQDSAWTDARVMRYPVYPVPLAAHVLRSHGLSEAASTQPRRLRKVLCGDRE